MQPQHHGRRCSQTAHQSRPEGGLVVHDDEVGSLHLPLGEIQDARPGLGEVHGFGVQPRNKGDVQPLHFRSHNVTAVMDLIATETMWT